MAGSPRVVGSCTFHFEQGRSFGSSVHSSHRHSQHRSLCRCTDNIGGHPAWRAWRYDAHRTETNRRSAQKPGAAKNSTHMGDGVVLPSIVPVPFLSPTVPCHQRRLATMHIQIGLSNARSQCETTWKNGYECEVYGGMHVGR